MKINKQTGLIDGAKILLSPNCDERPDSNDITGIVIHNISLPPQEYGGDFIQALFMNQLDYSQHPYFEQLKGLEVSSHILIKRDGSIIQFVPFHQRAWHAGASEWAGRTRCNDFTIGIEFEGDDYSPFLAGQYRQAIELINALFATYPNLNKDRITGHEHIAPDRKTDPGPYFNWPYLRASLE